MMNQAQVSVQTNTFRPRDYDVFAGLDVDHHSIAATFTDHDRLMRSLRLSYSAAQLLSYVRKHFRESDWRLFMKPGSSPRVSTTHWLPCLAGWSQTTKLNLWPL
jgi:hypothetical protein